MLILASASPRRRELLTQAGFVFEVRPAHVNEDVRAGEDAIAYVTRLAREKAQAVLDTISSSGINTEASNAQRSWSSTQSAKDADWMGHRWVVLGADTTVTVDGQILAKPEDAEDAKRMLRLLSGQTHRVITGVAVVTATRAEVAAEVTGVRFVTMSEAEIAAYVATGEPMDKAGAYGIQGRAARWIPRVEGCYFNVVGLPLALVTTMLEALGVRPAGWTAE